MKMFKRLSPSSEAILNITLSKQVTFSSGLDLDEMSTTLEDQYYLILDQINR
jgi:hypothetical protein